MPPNRKARFEIEERILPRSDAAAEMKDAVSTFGRPNAHCIEDQFDGCQMSEGVLRRPGGTFEQSRTTLDDQRAGDHFTLPERHEEMNVLAERPEMRASK